VNRHRRIVDEMSFEHGQEAAFCGSLPGMTHMLTLPGFLAEILNFEGDKSGNFEGGKSGNIEDSSGCRQPDHRPGTQFRRSHCST
jgi:hypothetical protein